jgi:hypothetical protein
MLESNDNKKKKFRSIQQHGSLSTYIFWSRTLSRNAAA